MFDPAEGMVFRPPSEANSFILRVTIGCSHNRCAFCSMYRNVKFRIRPMNEVEDLIKKGAAYYPNLRRVFLADGDALVLPTEKLLTILGWLHQYFPALTRVSAYAGPKDLLRKTPGELKALKEAGLKLVYLGIESGDDEVLAKITKGVTAEEMIEAGQKALASGMKLSAMVILGLGGKAGSAQHAKETAKVVSAINPTMLSALTLMLHEGTPMRQWADEGEFIMPDEWDILTELKILLENIEMTRPCIFRSNHISNLVPVAGNLPADQQAMVEQLAEALAWSKHRRMPKYNDIGEF